MNSNNQTAITVAKANANASAGRPLTNLQQAYFVTGESICGTWSFDSKAFTRRQAKWDAAFHRIVKRSEILRMRIVGQPGDKGDDRLRFVPMSSADEHPKLIIRRIKATAGNEKQFLKEETEKISAPILESFKSAESDHRRKPITMFALLAKKRISLTAIVPHTFADGGGVLSIAAMLLTYVRMPRVSWSFLDRMCPKEHPDIVEMASKGDMPMIEAKYDGRLSLIPSIAFDIPEDAGIFHVPSSEDIPTRSWDRHISFDAGQTKRLREAIRETGFKVTPVFVALTAKLAVRLLEKYSSAFDSDTRRQAVEVLTPFDCRGLGKWGDKRDKKWHFPVIGDYASYLATHLVVGEVLDESFEAGAERVSDDIKRLKTDTEFRLGHVKKFEEPACGMFLGCSSVQSSTDMLKFVGMTDIEIDSGLDFADAFYTWSSVISTMKEMHVKLELRLPLADVSDADIEQTVAEIVEGTCLEMIGSAL